jgi:hypothetical protein
VFLPIGPDFVFGPRDFNFERVSVRDEFGCQAMVRGLTTQGTSPPCRRAPRRREEVSLGEKLNAVIRRWRRRQERRHDKQERETSPARTGGTATRRARTFLAGISRRPGQWDSWA